MLMSFGDLDPQQLFHIVIVCSSYPWGISEGFSGNTHRKKAEKADQGRVSLSNSAVPASFSFYFGNGNF